MSAVYIAGPMRNRPYYNVPEFEAAASNLRKRSYRVISPAEHEQVNGVPLDRLDSDHVFLRSDLAEVILGDCRAICEEDVDRIALLQGWAESKGARVEFALGEFLGCGFINKLDKRLKLASLKRTLAEQLLREARELEEMSDFSLDPGGSPG